MIQFDEARRLILATVPLLPTIQLPLLGTLNMIAAETVPAQWDLPSFDNSAMDGYAVRAHPCSPLKSLPGLLSCG